VVDEAGRVVQPALSIENRRESFNLLAMTLAASSEPVAIGLEVTGRCWLALYDDLTQQGYAVTMIEPLLVVAYRRPKGTASLPYSMTLLTFDFLTSRP
jgi:transposase